VFRAGKPFHAFNERVAGDSSRSGTPRSQLRNDKGLSPVASMQIIKSDKPPEVCNFCGSRAQIKRRGRPLRPPSRAVLTAATCERRPYPHRPISSLSVSRSNVRCPWPINVVVHGIENFGNSLRIALGEGSTLGVQKKMRNTPVPAELHGTSQYA